MWRNVGGESHQWHGWRKAAGWLAASAGVAALIGAGESRRYQRKAQRKSGGINGVNEISANQ
jgi:hypothetical protein